MRFGSDQIYSYTHEQKEFIAQQQVSKASMANDDLNRGRTAKENRRPTSLSGNILARKGPVPAEDERSAPHIPLITLQFPSFENTRDSALSRPSHRRSSAAKRTAVQQPPIAAPRRRLPAPGLIITM